MACSDDFCPLSVRVLYITRAQSAWDVVAFDAASDNATNVNEPNPLLALFVCHGPSPTQPNPTLRSIFYCQRDVLYPAPFFGAPSWIRNRL